MTEFSEVPEFTWENVDKWGLAVISVFLCFYRLYRAMGKLQEPNGRGQTWRHAGK